MLYRSYRIPDEPGHPTGRQTMSPLYNVERIAEALEELLRLDQLADLANHLDAHLDAPEPPPSPVSQV